MNPYEDTIITDADRDRFPPADRWRVHMPQVGSPSIGYYDADGVFCTPYFKTSGGYAGVASRAATEEEIVAAVKIIVGMEQFRAKRDVEESATLALVGLSTSDFCRFRSAVRDGDEVFVETRENGVGGCSVEALKRAAHLLVSRENDEGDSTYAYYRFRIPEVPDAK